MHVADISRSYLREQVYHALHAALISGEMAPGETYSVPSLATRFDVSATPVREAMLDLVNEGMLLVVPNKGFRVVEISDEELDDITHIRQLLEVPPVAALTGKIGPEQMRTLRDMVQDILAAADNGNLVDYLEADRRFHIELLLMAGNLQLTAMVEQLRARTRLYGLANLVVTGEIQASAKEHVDLLDLLERGAPADQVAALLHSHIGHTRGVWAGKKGSA